MKKTITIFLTIMLMLFINVDVKAESLKENLKHLKMSFQYHDTLPILKMRI